MVKDVTICARSMQLHYADVKLQESEQHKDCLRLPPLSCMWPLWENSSLRVMVLLVKMTNPGIEIKDTVGCQG